MIKYNYNDGGRAAAGYKGTTGDCVCRAIAIAAEKPYQEVYDLINEFAKKERITKNNPTRSSARTGVNRKTAAKVLEHYGFTWVPTMTIGSGCKIHLDADELPSGRLVCNLSRHYVAVVDGTVNDIYDPSREGTRCVYGYWVAPTKKPAEKENPIKNIRKLTGLSQAAFAKHYEIPQRSIENWESGSRIPPEYVVKLLERVVKIDWVTTK